MAEVAMQQYEEILRKVNERTRTVTEFYDVSEAAKILKEKLPEPVLPQLMEYTPNKTLPFPFHISAKSFELSRPSGLKHIAQSVLQKEFLHGVQLVCYTKCQNITPDALVSEEDLLFQGTRVFDEDVGKLKDFASNHSEKCLFLLDSVDNCLGAELEEKCQTSQRQKRDTRTILRDLVNGRLFPDSRVIATARYIITSLQPQARYIALAGLDFAGIHEILTKYLGKKKGDEAWEQLQVASPSLVSLCTTPVFLVYTLMARISDKNSFDAITISEVMIHAIECFLRSEHSQQKQKNIEPAIRGLKTLAREGIERGILLFSLSDLQKHNLARKDAGDFTSPLLFKLLRGQQSFHFNHLSLQEAFAGLSISEMESESFKSYAREKLFPLRHYGTVGKLVFGFLLDPKISRNPPLFTEIENLRSNRNTLLQLMQTIVKSNSHLDDIEIISKLHEAQDGVSDQVLKGVHSIRTDWPLLSPNDLHIIGSLAKRCKCLNELSIKGGLVGGILEILHKCMKNSGREVPKLTLSGNHGLGNEGVHFAGKLASECKSSNVKLDDCSLVPDQIITLQQAIGNHELEKLDLSWNSEVQSGDLMTPETEDVQGHCYFKADIKSVRSPSLSTAHMQQFKKQLEEEEFQCIFGHPGKWKVATKEITQAILKIMPCVTKKIKLYGWKFEEDNLALVQQKLAEIDHAGLEIVFRSHQFSPARRKSTDFVNSVSTKKSVRCEETDESIEASWSALENVQYYVVQVVCMGEKIEEVEVTVPRFVLKKILPSTTYEIIVSAKYANEVEEFKYESERVVTKPSKPTDVMATVTNKGILVTWKPGRDDTVDTYKVETVCMLDKRRHAEIYGKTEYCLTNPVPGSKYQFGVCAFNPNRRKGEMAWSNHVNIPGKGKTSDLEHPQNRTEEKGSPQQILESVPDSTKDTGCKSGNKKHLGDIQAGNQLEKWCRERQGVRFYEIQIAHRPFDKDKSRFLANILKMSSSVAELQMRDCNLNIELLTDWRHFLEDSNCKVDEFTVSGQGSIKGMVELICEITQVLGAEVLKLAGNNIQSETIESLVNALNHKHVKCLQGLDVSYNQNIGNWENLGKILCDYSMTTFRAMNCDLTMDGIQKLKSGCLKSKVQHLDLSYNSELTTKCFAIIPNLLDPSAKSLVLSDCGLTEYEIEAFDLSAPAEMKLDAIDVSYNEDLEAGGMTAIGKLALNRKTTNLGLAGCELDGELIEALSTSLQNQEVTEISMSDNASIGDDVERVSEFTKKHKVQNLDISECGIDANQITLFCNGLLEMEKQVSVLNLSDSSRIADTTHVKSICGLIPLVKEELVIIFPRMERGCLEILQDTLNHLCVKGPKITYAITVESTDLVNDIKFISGIKKEFLEKKSTNS